MTIQMIQHLFLIRRLKNSLLTIGHCNVIHILKSAERPW